MHWLRNLLFRKRAHDDLAEEIREHMAERTAALIAQGRDPEEAAREARRAFGNITLARERSVEVWQWRWLENLWADLRFALHQLRHHPGFAVVGILTLALGIGASTAIFSAVNPILFEPLPYPRPGRIMMIWNTFQGARSEIAFGTYRELAERCRSLDATAIFEPWRPAITGGNQPERLEGQSVSASFFRVLGVSPILGRDFRASEDVFNGPKVVILSDKFRRRLFHDDPAILGRTVKLDDDSYTVIGVMPSDFEDVLAPAAEIWTPTQYDTRHITNSFNTWEWGNHLRMVGRLRPGIGRLQAIQELAQIARTPWPQFPRPRWASLQHGLIVDSLQDEVKLAEDSGSLHCPFRRGSGSAREVKR